MSYTMTRDMPQKEASYFARHSAQCGWLQVWGALGD